MKELITPSTNHSVSQKNFSSYSFKRCFEIEKQNNKNNSNENLILSALTCASSREKNIYFYHIYRKITATVKLVKSPGNSRHDGNAASYFVRFSTAHINHAPHISSGHAVHFPSPFDPASTIIQHSIEQAGNAGINRWRRGLDYLLVVWCCMS